MNKSAQKPNRVTAVFQDSRLSFDLARGATFAQLAERLGGWVKSMAVCRCQSNSACPSTEHVKFNKCGGTGRYGGPAASYPPPDLN